MEKQADYLAFAADKEIIKLFQPDEKLLFTDKLHKYNPFGWKQERNIIITNKFIYNLKKKSLKRKISLLNVAATTVSESKESQEFVIHVPSEYDYRYTSPRRGEIIDLLRQLYLKIQSKPMPRYAVPHLYLKEFTTTKSEMKKNKFRIPEETYRVPDGPAGGASAEDSKGGIAMFEESKSRSKMLFQRNTTEKPVTLGDFKIIKKLGRGTFGTVYLAEKVDTGMLYAMKQLRKDAIIKSDALVCTKLEKEVLKRSHHPFLVGLDYVFQSPVNIYFIMKFYRGGELYNHLMSQRRFSEANARFYAAQIAMALGELHRNKIIYRDMKPENILLDVDGYIALADFGLAKIVEENQSTMTFCGTPEYISPEIVNGVGHNKQVDWWGLGVLLYEMMIGVPPFHNKNQHVLFQYITSKDVIFPDPKRYNIIVSDEAKDLIVKLLKKKPNERLGATKDVDEVLAHPFFKSIDAEKLLKKELIAEYKPPVSTTDKYDLQNFQVEGGAKEALLMETVDAKSMEVIQKNEKFFKDFVQKKGR